jgi:hypothetical protein
VNVIGFICIVLGGLWAARSFYKLFRWHKAYGTVKEMVGGMQTVGEHRPQQMVWRPKIEFIDRIGNVVTFVSDFRLGRWKKS